MACVKKLLGFVVVLKILIAPWLAVAQDPGVIGWKNDPERKLLTVTFFSTETIKRSFEDKPLSETLGSLSPDELTSLSQGKSIIKNLLPSAIFDSLTSNRLFSFTPLSADPGSVSVDILSAAGDYYSGSYPISGSGPRLVTEIEFADTNSKNIAACVTVECIMLGKGVSITDSASKQFRFRLFRPGGGGAVTWQVGTITPFNPDNTGVLDASLNFDSSTHKLQLKVQDVGNAYDDFGATFLIHIALIAADVYE